METMDSKDLKKIIRQVLEEFDIEADLSGLNEWRSFGIIDGTENRPKYPKNSGCYFFRQEGGKKWPYTKSDIVKIGETAERDGLHGRMWKYQRKIRITKPYPKKGEQKRQTAWKVRHFMKYVVKGPLEVAYFELDSEHSKKTKDIEKELKRHFDPLSDEEPLLEGHVKDYQKWCMSTGLVDEKDLNKEV